MLQREKKKSTHMAGKVAPGEIDLYRSQFCVIIIMQAAGQNFLPYRTYPELALDLESSAIRDFPENNVGLCKAKSPLITLVGAEQFVWRTLICMSNK